MEWTLVTNFPGPLLCCFAGGFDTLAGMNKAFTKETDGLDESRCPDASRRALPWGARCWIIRSCRSFGRFWEIKPGFCRYGRLPDPYFHIWAGRVLGQPAAWSGQSQVPECTSVQLFPVLDG